MNSLYNRLMAEKGAPRAANNPNTTQLRSAPMNLRSAMNKYAMGGGVGSPPPSASDINSFVQANMGNPQAILQAAQRYGVSMDDLANATGYSSGQIDNYFGNAGINFGGSQTKGPPMDDFDAFNQDMRQPKRPPEPRYQDEIPPRPKNPDRDTLYIPPQQPQGPRTSYRQNDDGSLMEIGYDGQPVSDYTAQQMAMHLATTGVIPSEFQYVYNGQGYDKVPIGGQIGGQINYRPDPVDSGMYRDIDPVSLGVMDTSENYDYGSVPESERENIDRSLKALQNPPQMAPSSTIPPGFVEAIARQLSQGKFDPFGTEITRQDQIMKLLQSLGMK